MKKYLPWLIAIGLIIAGATVWYVYGDVIGGETAATKTKQCSGCPEKTEDEVIKVSEAISPM